MKSYKQTHKYPHSHSAGRHTIKVADKKGKSISRRKVPNWKCSSDQRLNPILIILIR